MFSIIKDSRKN